MKTEVSTQTSSKSFKQVATTPLLFLFSFVLTNAAYADFVGGINTGTSQIQAATTALSLLILAFGTLFVLYKAWLAFTDQDRWSSVLKATAGVGAAGAVPKLVSWAWTVFV